MYSLGYWRGSHYRHGSVSFLVAVCLCFSLVACAQPSQSDAPTQMTEREAEEYLNLDDWVCVQKLCCSDGETAELDETATLDGENKVVREYVYSEDGDLHHTVQFSYDENGLPSKEEVVWPGGNKGSVTTYSYDEGGQLVEEVNDNLGIRTRTEYSSGVIQRVTKCALDDEGNEGSLYSEDEYNSNGDITHGVSYESQTGEVDYEEYAEYDEQGRITSYSNSRRTLAFEYSEDGLLRTTYKDGEWLSEDTLDACGNLLSGYDYTESYIDMNGRSEDMFVANEYNEYSQLIQSEKEVTVNGYTTDTYKAYTYTSSARECNYYDEHGLLLASYFSGYSGEGTSHTYAYVNRYTGEWVSGGDPVKVYQEYDSGGNESS